MPSYVSSFLLLAPTQNFQDLEKSACSRDSKADEAHRVPKELSSDISALCLLQDSRKAYHARVKPIIDPLLPRKQAGFLRGQSTVDQVIY